MSLRIFRYRAFKSSPPVVQQDTYMFIKDKQYLVTRIPGDEANVLADGFFLSAHGVAEFCSLVVSKQLCRDYLTLIGEIKALPPDMFEFPGMEKKVQQG